MSEYAQLMRIAKELGEERAKARAHLADCWTKVRAFGQQFATHEQRAGLGITLAEGNAIWRVLWGYEQQGQEAEK